MKPIRVLIVDDSAFARKVIREVLARDPAIEVLGFARDGLEALEKISELKPGVVTLDLVMPEMDGLSVLRALKGAPALPNFLIVSASGADTELVMDALELGATDVVTKPTAQATDRLFEIGKDLINKVKAVAQAHSYNQKFSERSSLAPPPGISSAELVVIGTSTGGPQALSQLFSSLPAGLPVPILVALHIPAGYTAPLAARISQGGAIFMKEAADGMEFEIGHAYIAPGGKHLKVKREGHRFFAIVTSNPTSSLFRPSVDILFESAAEAAGAAVVGLVMTGMGNDGEKGSAAIRKAGGRVIAESEESCVIFGMPRCVIEAGLATDQAPLDELASRLVFHIYEKSSPETV